jgi:hypothetical protein
MPKTMTEFMNGGVVTARVGALLNSGELQRADDCVYREKDPAIWRAPGRTALTASALGTDVRGVGQLSFDGTYVDQFVMLTRRTDGSPTWSSGPDTSFPGFHLYGADFTAVTGLAPAEVGGQGRWYGNVTGTTLDCNIAIASCTITGGTTVTAASGTFRDTISVGAVVSGSGVTSGTRVLSVDSDTQITLDTAATNATVTLTFTQYPFLSSAVGARITGTNIGTNVRVTAVSNQDGTTGHFRTATLSVAPSGGNGNYRFVAVFGTAYDWQNTGSEVLDFIQYGARRYYMWDGFGTLQCAEWKSRASASDATLGSVLGLRPVGLKPVETAPTIVVQTGQATGWNAVKGAGKYWILITEIFSPEQNIATALKDPVLRTQIIESAYLAADNTATDDNGSQSGVGLPIGVTIVTVASDNIKITFPAVTNDGKGGFIATHWGVYIYGPASDLPSLAQLRRCATVPITTYAAGATFTLTDSTLTQTKWPTALRTAAGRPSFGHNDYLLSDAAAGGFDNLDAYTKVGGSGKHIPDNAAQGLTTYGFSTTGTYASKPIFGVEVQVRGRCNPSGDTTHSAAYWFRIMTTGGAKTSDTFYGNFGGQDNHTNYHGGPMDTLGVAWATSDPPLMEIEIGIANRGSKDELDLDSVAIKVYYTTTNVDFNGPAYRVVTYRDQVGLTVSDPARLLPPVPTTGDFFQGCMVLNNKAQQNQIRYSLPGDPEAWPKPYELTFNTRKRDKVTFIKTMDSILIVGMENSLKRVNYLPRETDTDMNSGLAHEDIATDHGIPGPLCAVTFDMPGRGIMLAYASTVGMFISNGIWTLPLNLDLDWASTVKLSALGTAVLKVYPKEKWLALYYCPAGATHNKNTRVLYFCYQADKLKGDYSLPAVGPCVVSARSSCEAYLSGTPYLFTGHEADGKVYVEDSGITIPSGYQARLNDDSANGDGKTTAATDVKIIPFIRSRKFYPVTLDRDGYGEKVYLMFSAFGSNSVTASSTTTVGSTAITSSAAFGSVVPGMRLLGTGIDPGTIVLSKTNSSTIVVSRAANASGTNTLTFDTGTLGVTVRGSNLGENVKGLRTDYLSTLSGDLISVVNSNIRRGFELQIEKTPLTFDANGDTLTWADLATNMRLHTFTYVVSEQGQPDTNRNAA